MDAQRNKTLRLSVEEGRPDLERCLRITRPAELREVVDRTIVGDAFQVLPLLPRASVDLLIADPPYNLDKKFHGSAFRRLPEEEYEEYTANWLELVRPLLKPTASLYVCCDWRSSAAVSRALARFFTIRNRITWQREKGRGSRSNWKNAMEDIWFATVSARCTFNLDAVRMRRRVIAPYRVDGAPKDWEETPDGNFRDTCPSNFWDDISVPYWSMAENTAHPTQKPEKLLAKLILASSNPGDLVLDPFAGSGSTAVTAKKLGRRFIGIEQNEQYCVWAEKRLENADSDPTIQGYADGVFWERNTAAWQKKKRRS